MNSICHDGRILPSDRPVFHADNKGYRYGDGLFETMRVHNGIIKLEELHFERFFAGVLLLRLEPPKLLTTERLRKQILLLCEKNKCGAGARVRLSAYRGNGGIFEGDNELHYLIECWPLEPLSTINENGLTLGIYPNSRKSTDSFASLKSANCLPYTMAARYAREQKLNDCLVLNDRECIADSSIANIFIVKAGQIFTPQLGEGPVAGVMRRYLLSRMSVTETVLKETNLLEADEIFLSNAIYGIKWVSQFQHKTYSNQRSTSIFQEFISTI